MVISGGTVYLRVDACRIALRASRAPPPTSTRTPTSVPRAVGKPGVEQSRRKGPCALWGIHTLVSSEPRQERQQSATGWGNLGCAVDHAAEYHEVATSPDGRRRKWGPCGMLTWVDEWYGCLRFEVRPVGYGYRVRTR